MSQKDPQTSDKNGIGLQLQERAHGERLLRSGQVSQAAKVFEAILDGLGDKAGLERATLLGQIGHCLHRAAKPWPAANRFREAIATAAELEPSDSNRRLLAVLYANLGDVLKECGQYVSAKEAQEAALEIWAVLGDLRGQALAHGQLGTWALSEGRLEEALTQQLSSLAFSEKIQDPGLIAAAKQQLGFVFHQQQKWDEAMSCYEQACEVLEAAGNRTGSAQLWGQLALLCQQACRVEEAETWLRKIVDWSRDAGQPVQLGRHLAKLAALLCDQPDRLIEARSLAEQALVAMRHAPDGHAAEDWPVYGILSKILSQEATGAVEEARRIELNTLAAHYRQLSQYGPKFVAALARLGDEAPYAKAVLLGRLGRCFQMAGRHELAIRTIGEAIATIETLSDTDDVKGLRGSLRADLGEAYMGAGQYLEATQAYDAALESFKVPPRSLWAGPASEQVGHLCTPRRSIGASAELSSRCLSAISAHRRTDLGGNRSASAWDSLTEQPAVRRGAASVSRGAPATRIYRRSDRCKPSAATICSRRPGAWADKSRRR